MKAKGYNEWSKSINEMRGYTTDELRKHVVPLLRKLGIGSPSDEDVKSIVGPIKDLIKDKKLGVIFEDKSTEE